MLQHGSNQNTIVINFIKNPLITTNASLFLYLLYLRFEKIKKEKKISPFYGIYCFFKYECKGDPEKITLMLSSKEAVNKIVNKYVKVLVLYYNGWTKKNGGKEYNDMIKSKIDIDLLDDKIETVNSLDEL